MSKPYTLQQELIGKTLIRYIVGSCGFESLEDARKWSKNNYSGKTLKIVKKTTTWEEVNEHQRKA